MPVLKESLRQEVALHARTSSVGAILQRGNTDVACSLGHHPCQPTDCVARHAAERSLRRDESSGRTESSDGLALRERIVAVLSDAGYEVSTDYRDGMKAVVVFDPDVVVLGANPPQLDCCDLLSEVKGSERTHSIRVVMLAPGRSAERTRALDLGPMMCCHCPSTHTSYCRGYVRSYGTNPSPTSFESVRALPRKIETLLSR